MMACSCFALQMAVGAPIQDREVTFKGITSKNGWTYYAGSFWANSMDVSPDGKSVWMTSPVGIIRYDVDTGEAYRWTTLDGLADNTTYAVDFDSNGRVWIGARSGVSRFDGKVFRNWYEEDIGHFSFGALTVDNADRVWAGSSADRYCKGAFCLLPDGQWIMYNTWSLHDNGGFFSHVKDSVADPKGGTWLCGTYGGLALEGSYGYHTPWGCNVYYMDHEGTANWVRPLPKRDKEPLWPQEMAIDPQGNLYVLFSTEWRAGGGRALYKLVVKNWFQEQGQRIPDLSNVEWQELLPPAGGQNKLIALHTDQKGDLWLATKTEIGRLTAKGFEPVVPLPHANPRGHYSPKLFGFVTLNAGKDILCFYARRFGFFHYRNGVWTHVQAKLDGPVRGGRGFPIIGSTGRGPDGKMYFSRNTTTVFDGETWVHIKRRTGYTRDKFDRIHALGWRDPELKKDVMWFEGKPGPIPREDVFKGLGAQPDFVDSKGHYWALNRQVLELDGKKVVDHAAKNPYLFRQFQAYYNRRASRIAEDEKGRIFIATQWGLVRKGRLRSSSWTVVGSKFKGMLGMSLWMWASNGKDTIAFGGPWGSSDYNTLTGEWKNYIKKDLKFPGTISEFPGSMVEYAAADLQGRIWYGFYESGVSCRERDGSLTNYSVRDGLANGSVWGIWADTDGTMWFNTFSGTNHFDPKAYKRPGAE